MALQPDYTAGMITLTSGSKNFTTSGAALQTAAIQAGDTIFLPAKGTSAVIATITGQNAGTLTDNCPASMAGAGQSYRIRFQSDIARVAAYTRELIQLLGAGNNEALAALDGTGGNKFPVFTGTAAMAVRSIVGTVSQSGGVPTGAIVEAGASANGKYVRFAGGAQFCWHNINLGSPTAVGSGTFNDPYRTAPASWNIPVNFSETPSVTASFEAEFAQGVRMGTVMGYYLASAVAVAGIQALRIGNSADTSDWILNIMASGRWH